MIRKFSVNDIDQIVKLEELTLGSSLGKDMLQAELNNELSYIYVYEVAGNIIAYISVVFDGYCGEIYNFCVLPEYQNQGIGSKLLDFIINMLKEKKASTMILDVREGNNKAIHVYEKYGFKQISVRKAYYKNNDNALILQKIFD